MSPNETKESSNSVPNVGRNPIKLTDIPLELLLNIYEFLEVSSLATAAMTHSYSRQAAEMVFKNQFSRNFNINGMRLNHGQIMIDTNYSFEFTGMLLALELFGHLITKLTIDYHFLNEKQCEKINKRLSEYVANSLIEIELIHCNHNNLVGFTRALYKAEVVVFHDGHISSFVSIRPNIDLSRLFPMVIRLNLQTMSFMSIESTERNFAHLEELELETSLATSSDKLSQRLRLNPQLRKLTLYGGNWITLKMLSEVLINLEHLDYHGFFCKNFRGEEVTFENMKVFEVSTSQEYPEFMEFVPIRFGSLEEIRSDGNIDLWMDIILQNRKLKKITFGQFNCQQLQRIVEELPNFVEFKLQFNPEINCGDIVRCIGMSKSLKRFTFYRSNTSFRNELSRKLSDWTMVEEDGLFVFVRRSIH